MDTMTLLCNLQAEGPTTLRRLREHGCGTFEELRRTPIQRLALALGSDEGTARRFQREAEALEQRYGPEGLEPEEVGSVMSTATAGGAQRSAPGTPLRRPLPAGVPLEPHMLAGLDGELCRLLEGLGVRTLEQLWEVSALELSRKLQLPFPALVDLQCGARQELARRRAGGGQTDRAMQLARDADTPAYTVIPASSSRPRTAVLGELGIPAQRVGITGEWTATESQPGAGGPFA
jgi:hypothetical protein